MKCRYCGFELEPCPWEGHNCKGWRHQHGWHLCYGLLSGDWAEPEPGSTPAAEREVA